MGQPYVYILQRIDIEAYEGKYYIGAKYGNDSDPCQLLNENHPSPYWSSSQIVSPLAKEGKYFVRKVFLCDSQKAAKDLENKWLSKVKVPSNKMFANLSGGGGIYCQTDPRIIEQKMKTCRANHGVDFPMQASHILDKRRENSINKFGAVHHLQTKKSMDRLRNTNIQKYGVEYPIQLEEVKEKRKQTILNKTGFENNSQDPEFKRRMKLNNLEKYGFEHVSQIPEVKEKQKKIRQGMSSRPIVSEIKAFLLEHKITIGKGWYQKRTEVLETILQDLKITHGAG